MPKAHQTKTVLSHGAIEKVAENIWRVEGILPGPPIPRTMTIVRLSDGRLITHSAVALDELSMKEIESWGKLAFLLVPGIGHRLDAKIYKDRYPAITVMCPAGAQKKVEQVLRVDRTDSDFGDPNVTWATLDGTGGREGVLTVRSTGGTTLILNDTMDEYGTASWREGVHCQAYGLHRPNQAAASSQEASRQGEASAACAFREAGSHTRPPAHHRGPRSGRLRPSGGSASTGRGHNLTSAADLVA